MAAIFAMVFALASSSPLPEFGYGHHGVAIGFANNNLGAPYGHHHGGFGHLGGGYGHHGGFSHGGFGHGGFGGFGKFLAF